MINRPEYIKKLDKVRDKQVIKVLTGARRCGKSTILELFQTRLLETGTSPKQIQSMNMESLDNAVFKDYQKLHTHLKENFLPDKMNYVFLDEVQLIPNFELMLDSLFIEQNVDLYVTGSTAYMLSGDLATMLSGRYIEIHVLPLSFKEYLSTTSLETALAFQHYLDYGGFPLSIVFTDDNSYTDYVNGIVNTVLVKDILVRKQRSDALLVEQLAKFLTDTTGNLINMKKIADTLTSLGQKTSSETVASYISAFLDAYLFYRCDRYDISGKKHLSTNAKYYPVDSALRRALLGNRRPNLGNRLENIVYLELVRRGYEIYVGVIGDVEIDFIAQKDGVTEYYQVSYTVSDMETYEREVKSLKLLSDNYRKILLTYDLGNYNDEGIEQLNVIDWLLE